MYIEDMWPTCIINPSYKILYDFLHDPRNINSKEVAIHNKLREERIRNKTYIYLGRGNGKWLTTQRLMEEMFNGGFVYTARRNDIPKRVVTIEQVQDGVKYFRRLSDQANRYEQIGEYIHGLEHRRLWERDQKQVYITSANPYWDKRYLGIWPNSWKLRLSDDELRQSDST